MSDSQLPAKGVRNREGYAAIPKWIICPEIIGKLSASSLKVLLCLGMYANRDGKSWPAIQTISENVGCDPRSVKRGIRELRRFGIIITNAGGGRWRSGEYISTTYFIQKERGQICPGAVTSLSSSGDTDVTQTTTENYIMNITPLPPKGAGESLSVALREIFRAGYSDRQMQRAVDDLIALSATADQIEPTYDTMAMEFTRPPSLNGFVRNFDGYVTEPKHKSIPLAAKETA